MAGDIEAVPDKYREPLLELRRARVLANYEELNNYYRMLNGYPNLKVNPDDETKLDMDENDRYYIDPMDLFYVPEELANKYNVPELYTDRIPIHYIQDYYNKIEPTRGFKSEDLINGLKCSLMDGFVEVLKSNIEYYVRHGVDYKNDLQMACLDQYLK